VRWEGATLVIGLASGRHEIASRESCAS
jgi:hypothetical protein